MNRAGIAPRHVHYVALNQVGFALANLIALVISLGCLILNPILDFRIKPTDGARAQMQRLGKFSQSHQLI